MSDCDPLDCSPQNSPGQNTGMGSLSLLQGIFLTKGSNPSLYTAGGFFTSQATRKASSWSNLSIISPISDRIIVEKDA